MKTCYILIGVPASGKSTWLSEEGVDAEVLASSDNTIEVVAARYGMTYSQGFKTLIDFAQLVFENDLKTAIKDNLNIVIDRTNLTPKVRKRFIDMFKKAGYKITAIYFETPQQAEWDRRIKSRPGKEIPDYVLKSMSLNFTIPSLEEGFDEIIAGELHEEFT